MLEMLKNTGVAFLDFLKSTGVGSFFTGKASWLSIIMILISCVLLFLAIVKKFEPLLLIPIATGMYRRHTSHGSTASHRADPDSIDAYR